jgi:glyoxylase-like metal-dependent hydrolase (beta-lactamase superfamily II)
MAGLDALRETYPQARFAASKVCNDGIQNTRLNMSRIMEVYLYFRGKPGIHYDPIVCRPADEIIDENAQLPWRGHTLRLVPLPGHTPGSAGIFLDEKVFFSGDYLIPDEEPLLRFPGGDADSYQKITEPFLQSLPAGIRICPGHGEPFDLQKK